MSGERESNPISRVLDWIKHTIDKITTLLIALGRTDIRGRKMSPAAVVDATLRAIERGRDEDLCYKCMQ